MLMILAFAFIVALAFWYASNSSCFFSNIVLKRLRSFSDNFLLTCSLLLTASLKISNTLSSNLISFGIPLFEYGTILSKSLKPFKYLL